jgi:hypothetical protein
MMRKEKKELYGTIVEAVGPGHRRPLRGQASAGSFDGAQGDFPGFGKKTLTTEVMQHIGDDTVRCVAMGATEGVERGFQVLDTEKPIEVPVGDKTLGRMFNVLGDPIDGLGRRFLEMKSICRSTARPPLSMSRKSRPRSSRPASRSSICFARTSKAAKSASSAALASAKPFSFRSSSATSRASTMAFRSSLGRRTKPRRQ